MVRLCLLWWQCLFWCNKCTSSAPTSAFNNCLLNFVAVWVLIVRHVEPSQMETLSCFCSLYFLLLSLRFPLTTEVLEKGHSSGDQLQHQQLERPAATGRDCLCRGAGVSGLEERRDLSK